MSAHVHRYDCDCRWVDPTVNRACCCVGGNACRKRLRCIECGRPEPRWRTRYPDR